jgi:hypothetical protein
MKRSSRFELAPPPFFFSLPHLNIAIFEVVFVDAVEAKDVLVPLVLDRLPVKLRTLQLEAAAPAASSSSIISNSGGGGKGGGGVSVNDRDRNGCWCLCNVV